MRVSSVFTIAGGQRPVLRSPSTRGEGAVAACRPSGHGRSRATSLGWLVSAASQACCPYPASAVCCFFPTPSTSSSCLDLLPRNLKPEGQPGRRGRAGLARLPGHFTGQQLGAQSAHGGSCVQVTPAAYLGPPPHPTQPKEAQLLLQAPHPPSPHKLAPPGPSSTSLCLRLQVTVKIQWVGTAS